MKLPILSLIPTAGTKVFSEPVPHTQKTFEGKN